MGILANAKSIVTNGPTAATTVLCNAPGGPIMDYAGNAQALVVHLQEANVLATKMSTDTDAGDPNKSLLTTILGQLV